MVRSFEASPGLQNGARQALVGAVCLNAVFLLSAGRGEAQSVPPPALSAPCAQSGDFFSDAFACGKGSSANNASTAVGVSAVATGITSTAVGRGAQGNGIRSTALGIGSSAGGYLGFGGDVPLNAPNTTALGAFSFAGAENSTAVGDGSTASGRFRFTLCCFAPVNNINATAVGAGAQAGATYFGQMNATAVGQHAVANAAFATALGQGSSAGGSFNDRTARPANSNANATAVGAGAEAGVTSLGQTNATAVGQGARANAQNGSAFGQGSEATAANSVALGQGSLADQPQTVSVGAMGSERRIVNLAGGLGGTDAVNVNQLNAAIASVPSPASMPIRENNSSLLPTPAATGFGAIAVGSGSVAPGDLSVAFGQTSIAGGNSSTALGRNAMATADFTTAVGNGALASAAEASALGQGATASGVGSVALGQGAQALGANSVALGGGQGAIASGLGSVALGQGAQALASSSIALGTGSIASQPNTVSLGAPGAERRIVNLAPGVSATDAVNVAQFNTSLKGLAQRSYSGIAIAMAMGGIIMPEGKTYAVSANYGGYRGENGFAGGLALRLNDYSFVNGAIGFGLEHGGVGGRAGVTVAW